MSCCGVEHYVSSTAINGTTLASSQVVDISTAGAIRIAAKSQAVWAKFGEDNTVAATAGTSGEMLIPADRDVFVKRQPKWTHVALIEDAASAEASVDLFG